jgi:ubiquitin-protein ligase
MRQKILMTRLNIENQILSMNRFQYHLSNENGDWRYRLWHKTLTEDRYYQLELAIPEHYPDEMPSLFVTSPIILPKYQNQGTVNNEQNSHNYHTGKNGPGGCVQICHSSSNNWDAAQTCWGVFNKGIMWLAAYDLHLINGKTVNENINELAWRI